MDDEAVQTSAMFGKAGFEARFDSLFGVAMGPALRILRIGAAAEDVAAEVLARLYVDWERLGAEEWVEAWVVRTSTNLAIDQVRRLRRSLPSVVPSPEGEWEIRMDLAQAVSALPRRQRESIALFYFGDLSEREVAALLGISVGSVKTHLHRGMIALRDRLGEASADLLAY